MLQYLLNGLLLFVPVFVWNAVYYKKLPEFYQPVIWDKIPRALDITENILRYLSFFIPILFRINFDTDAQKIGMVLYLAGLIIYFASWLLQIFFKESIFSKNPLLRMAPAYTTIIWLSGIGLVGKYTFVPGIQKFYFPIITVFVIIHTYHSFIIWKAIDRNKT